MAYPFDERHKLVVPMVRLPKQKQGGEFKTKCCDCLPELKLASTDKDDLIYNDVIGVVHKLATITDTCVFKIYKDGVLLSNVGVDYNAGFPFDNLVRAFVFNCRYYVINHGEGCYKVDKEYTIAGMSFTDEIGHYIFEEYTPDNAKGTVRALCQFNFETLWENETINYTDSGFEDSYRFRGFFGEWQPKVFSESDFSVRNENRTVYVKSKDTYQLYHYSATECHINRLHKLTMHTAIWRMTDHNPSNTLQEKKIYECVLDNENTEDITYNVGARKTEVRIILSKRQQNSVSLFGGSVEMPKGATWQMPSIGGGGGGSSPIDISANGDLVVAGATTNQDIDIIDTANNVMNTSVVGGQVVVADINIEVFLNGVSQGTQTAPAGDNNIQVNLI